MILATWSSVIVEKVVKLRVRTSGGMCCGAKDTGKVEQIC